MQATVTTEINTMAFACEMVITIKRLMSMAECKKYVKRVIIDTAEVVSIVQIGKEGSVTIINEKFAKEAAAMVA